MTRIEAAVRDYIKKRRVRARKEIAYFASMKSLEDVIEKATLSTNWKGKRFHHQRRLTTTSLQTAHKILLDVKNLMDSCKNFDQLLELIENEVRPVRGIGELYCYDVALRVGAYLGIKPEKVYLHSGTRVGAKAIGFTGKERALALDAFPPPLLALEPYEIEDLLCVYKVMLG